MPEDASHPRACFPNTHISRHFLLIDNIFEYAIILGRSCERVHQQGGSSRKMKTAKTLSVNLMMTSTATGIGADLANPVAAADPS